MSNGHLSLPVYPNGNACLMCGKEINLGIIMFLPIMDGAKVVLNGGRLEIEEEQVGFGLFHDACFAAGITIDYKKLLQVMRDARDNLFRGDF